MNVHLQTIFKPFEIKRPSHFEAGVSSSFTIHTCTGVRRKCPSALLFYPLFNISSVT